MINIYKKFTPSFQNIVRQYAIDCWYGRESEAKFLKRVQGFRKRYESEILKYYRSIGMIVSPKDIEEISLRWQAEQVLLAEKIKKHIKKKEKEKLEEKKDEIKKEIEKRYEDSKDPKRLKKFVPVIESISAGKMDKDFIKKPNQIGDESAFDLISEINGKILNTFGDTFDWQTQEDNNVRKTHRKMNKKTFRWDNLPKIDGEEVEPGSQWGCRCYAKKGTKKPLLNYSIVSKG